MKSLLAALMLLTASAHAGSPYKGVLDLGTVDPEAVVFRDAHYGMWLAGGQEQLWHLQNTKSGNEVFHVSGFWVTRLEGQDTMYGPSIGINFGSAVYTIVNSLEILAPLAQVTPPPWLTKFSYFTSLEGFGGYRFTTGADDGHWGYGVGARVTIPISSVLAWAKGTNGQKGL